VTIDERWGPFFDSSADLRSITMQRDMKVGMALGVALVGIVGALFFRRDPAPQDPSPPPLQGGEELDKQIAEKPKGPYIHGLDEFAEPAPAPPLPSSVTKSKIKPEAYEPPGFLTKPDEAEHRAFLTTKQPAAPDPIASPASREPKPQNAAGIPATPPAHNLDWEPSGTPTSRPASPPRSTAEGAQPGAARRMHVTQPGETLSGLAARYLGSSTRFREIYDANRNVLRTPDDLPDGVTLVIPDAGKTNAIPVAPNRKHSAEQSTSPRYRNTSTPSKNGLPAPDIRTPPTTGDEPSGKLRFAPVTRGPFSAGRTNGGSRAVPPPAEPPLRSDAKPPRPKIELESDDPF
jgi:LysM domain